MRRQRQEDQGVKFLFDYIAKLAWVAWDVLSKQNKQTTQENPNTLSNFLHLSQGKKDGDSLQIFDSTWLFGAVISPPIGHYFY